MRLQLRQMTKETAGEAKPKGLYKLCLQTILLLADCTPKNLWLWLTVTHFAMFIRIPSSS